MADPANTMLKRDLSISYTKLGDLSWARGEPAGARVAYEKGLELTMELTQADPQNVQWQVDLIFRHVKLIGVAIAANDKAALHIHRGAARAVLERLDRGGKGKGGAQVTKMRAILDELDK